MRNLVFLFLFTSSIAFSQSNEFTSILNLPSNNVKDMYGTSDEEGNVCLYYFTENIVFFSIFNNLGSLVKTIELPSNESIRILSVISDENNFCIYYNYYSSFNFKTINLLKISKEDGQYSHFADIIILNEKKEKDLAYFGLGKRFFFISSSEKSNKLFVKEFSGKETYKINEFEYCGFASTYFRFITSSYLGSVYSCHFNNKIYFQGNSIYSIMDFAEVTLIKKIDLKNNICTTKKILPEIKYYGEASSTFLLDNHLFRVRLSSDFFNLSIYEIDSLKLIKEYTFKPDDDFILKDGAVIMKGSPNIFIPESIEIEPTSTILKKLNDGYPSILVKKINDSSIKLLIGSYYVPNEGTEPYTPGINIRTPIGTLSTNGTFTPMSFGRVGEGEGVSTFFESTLSLPDFEKISKSDKEMDPVNLYINNLQEFSVKIGQWTVFSHLDGFQIAFVDMNEKSIKIVKVQE